MVDANKMKKTFTVPEIKPLDQYDFNRAKVCASVRWLLAKSYGSAENVPDDLREPMLIGQELQAGVSMLLLSPDLYWRAHSKLHLRGVPQGVVQGPDGVSQGVVQGPDGVSQGVVQGGDHATLLQLLASRGHAPRDQDRPVTAEDLQHTPIKTRAHLALIDALMSLAAMETVGRVKMAVEAEQIGGGAPWENALLFWVNRLNQRLRESTEDDEDKTQTCTDLQPVQPACPTRWYWKLVPHAIAFCLKESGNKPPVIRYRKDKVQSKLTPTFPLVSGVKDLSNGCAIAAVLHHYCPSKLPLEDVCLKDTMSVADSLYNLQLIRSFCSSSLQGCCPLAVEDLLYAPPTLHVNIMAFISELLGWFEVERPEFVQPLQPLDLTDASGLLDCTSPVSGNSNSGSPSFIFKQPFVPISSSPVSPEKQLWTKKQISRPLSAVTFGIPFGLDSDVDVVMGNPVRSVSTDSLVVAAVTSPLLGELPAIEEVVPRVEHAPLRGGGKEKGGGGGGRREPRLRPDGAPAGFFLHSPEEQNSAQLSSSAPCRSGLLQRPVGGEARGEVRGEVSRRRRADRHRRTSVGSRDDDSVLRDGSVDSSEASDDLPRNAPGNLRPSNHCPGDGGPQGNGPRMTSFAETRRERRSNPSTPGTPGRLDSPGMRPPEAGTEAWELGARLEERRKNMEAQKRRIEAIFTRHRQRLGKTAFLQLKREQGEEGGEGGGGREDSLTLEERLDRMEEQLKEEEEKEEKEEKGNLRPSLPRLEKQVTFSVETRKGADKETERGREKGGPEQGGGGGGGGEGVFVEYSEVVSKLSEALQALQSDMDKLTEQQQQLMMGNRPAPRHPPRTPPKTPTKTPPRTPTRTPSRTPTRTPTRPTSKAWIIPTGPPTPSNTTSPSRHPHPPPPSSSPKTPLSSSCPAPRTKIPSSSAVARSPRRQPPQPPHPRPSDLKFPPLTRVLTPPHTVDTLPHLRRVSPSQCHLQTSSSFRIGGPRTPLEEAPHQGPPAAPAPDDNGSETGSSETPTQFSLELEEGSGPGGGLAELTQPRRAPPGAGSSSGGGGSMCSFESDTLSLSAAYSMGGGGGEGGGGEGVKLSSLGGPGGGSNEPTDSEDQEIFSTDSMSDHTEPAGEPVEPREELEPREVVEEFREPAAEPDGEHSQPDTRGVGFFFKEGQHSEEEMAQRRAALLERQQRRAEELRRRRRSEQEVQTRPPSEDRIGSVPRTPPPPSGPSSPTPTPPATPGRRGDFTRTEYARRHQLRMMDELDKVLRHKPANQGRAAVKKPRPRPRSVTRDESQLSCSPAKSTMGSQLKKVLSHSSLNLAAAAEDTPTTTESTKPPSCPDSPSRLMSPSRLANQNGDKDWETGSNGSSPASIPEYTGPKLFKEPSFKSNKFIIHNALSRCCLAGKVNEQQKNKIVEEMEKSSANHFLILFRDSSCQFRGVYTLSPASTSCSEAEELVRLAGVGPRVISPTLVESIYKYSSDRKQFSCLPARTMSMSVDAFTIPSSLWQARKTSTPRKSLKGS